MVTENYGQFTGTVQERLNEWTAYSSLVRPDPVRHGKRKAKQLPALTLSLSGDYEILVAQKRGSSAPVCRILQLVAILGVKRGKIRTLHLWMVPPDGKVEAVEHVYFKDLQKAVSTSDRDPVRLTELKSIADYWSRNVRATAIGQDFQNPKPDSPKPNASHFLLFLFPDFSGLPKANSVMFFGQEHPAAEAHVNARSQNNLTLLNRFAFIITHARVSRRLGWQNDESKSTRKRGTPAKNTKNEKSKKTRLNKRKTIEISDSDDGAEGDDDEPPLVRTPTRTPARNPSLTRTPSRTPTRTPDPQPPTPTAAADQSSSGRLAPHSSPSSQRLPSSARTPPLSSSSVYFNIEHMMQQLNSQVASLTERLNQSQSSTSPVIQYHQPSLSSFAAGPLNFPPSSSSFSREHPYGSIALAPPPVSSIISQVISSNERIMESNQNLVWYATMNSGPPGVFRPRSMGSGGGGGGGGGGHYGRE